VIIINKEVAAETGQINVGGHELLHGIVQEHYNSLTPEARAKFINDFKNTISKESLEYIQNIIDARNKDTVDEKTGQTIKKVLDKLMLNEKYKKYNDDTKLILINRAIDSIRPETRKLYKEITKARRSQSP